MSIELRPYQTAAVTSIFEYFGANNGNPLVVMPTGVGKSIVIAEFCRKAKEFDPNVRIIIATHSKELVTQNYSKLINIAPELDIGIFSAGLKKKQRNCCITFAGIQSIHKHAFSFPKIDILVIDEAHTLPKSEDGTWRNFIADLTIANPDLRVVGLTATPFRMTQGNLHEGEGKIFDDICYEASLIDMIEQGWLSPLTNRRTETHVSVEGVHKRGGEYIASELEAAVNVDEVTQKCVAEIIKHGIDRKSWLIFCSGVKHSLAVRDVFRSHGISCETVTGQTPQAERDAILNQYKRGEIKCVTNNNVLTTGFDHPALDLIACLRPTGSPGLWVQMLGRGMRLSEDKKNCLILDHTNNTSVHGPIDKIKVKDKRGSGKGEAPSKLCPICFQLCPASVMTCAECGHVFPGSEGPDLNRRASTDALLSNQILPATHTVKLVSYFKHQKEGKPPTLRVDYLCGLKRVSEWVCLSHPEGSYPRRQAVRWWLQRAEVPNVPDNVDVALTMQKSLATPKEIFVRKEGKYEKVVGHVF